MNNSILRAGSCLAAERFATTKQRGRFIRDANQIENDALRLDHVWIALTAD